MQDKPHPSELIAIVARFLRQELMPDLDAHRAFQLRVAANALDLAARQLAIETDGNAQETRGLRNVLGHDGTLPALNAELAAAIADGRLTLEHPGLAELLWTTTLAKLAVDQPQYASYKRELERSRND